MLEFKTVKLLKFYGVFFLLLFIYFCYLHFVVCHLKYGSTHHHTLIFCGCAYVYMSGYSCKCAGQGGVLGAVPGQQLSLGLAVQPGTVCVCVYMHALHGPYALPREVTSS